VVSVLIWAYSDRGMLSADHIVSRDPATVNQNPLRVLRQPVCQASEVLSVTIDSIWYRTG